MKKLTCITILLIVGLVACNGQATTATPSPVVPTQTPLPTAIPTATFMPTLTINPSSTPTPNGTATANAAWEREATEFPDCAYEPLGIKRKKSPDGQWTASVCEYISDWYGSDGYAFPMNNYMLHIKKQDGSKEWKVSFKDLTGYEFVLFTNKYGEDAPFVSVPMAEHWYKDSRYLFVVPRIAIDGIRDEGLGLYRFDTQTGRLSPFLPSGESSYNFAFSPDDEYYVYQYGKDKKYIHIASLQSGKDQAIRLPIEKAYARSFIWAPDSTKFVFIYYNAATKKSSLVLFDTIQNAYIPLLEIDETHKFRYNLDLIEWVSNAQLKIWKEPSYYLLNVETKELQPISTQPSP